MTSTNHRRRFLMSLSVRLTLWYAVSSLLIVLVTLAAFSASSDEYRESLASNLEETVRLSRIIDSLLLLARAESPASELECEHFDVPAELERLRQFYEVLMEDADIEFVVQSSPNLRLLANRPLLQRAIGNLVENALTHATGVGQIAVCAFQKDVEIHIKVANDGGGIPPDDLPYVFDRFYRVQKDRSSLSGSFGLGLAIVRSIVELHGGSVTIDSVLDLGTTVSITLPLNSPPTISIDVETVMSRSSV